MLIDQPSREGGTRSTGNVAREWFLNKHDFISWVCTSIPADFRHTICSLHTNLSCLLRLFNCDKIVEVISLDVLCKDTYKSIHVEFPWANVTPSLPRLLAHAAELI